MDEQAQPVSYPARWLTASIGWPSFVGLLVAVTGLVTLGASVGSWGGVALIVVTMVAFIVLLTVWSSADKRGPASVRQSEDGG